MLVYPACGRDYEGGIGLRRGFGAVGMKADVRNDLLFVAGGAKGKAYVYNTKTGDDVKDYDLASGFINDVTLTPDGAWFTNSAAPELYFIPVSREGKLGKADDVTRRTRPSMPLTGTQAKAAGLRDRT